MTNHKEVSPVKIKSKISSSLVLKLNAGMIGRLISGFFWINILIILLSFFIIFWKVEEGIATIMSTSSLDSNRITKYQIHKVEEISLAKGVTFPDSIQEILPLKMNKVKRSVKLGRLDQASYQVIAPRKGEFYQITYSLESELRLLLLLFLVILLYELFIVIGNLNKGARRIRKTLKPLSDLAETAKSLNAKVASLGQNSDGRKIKDLAGVISNIDASKLGSRIAVDRSENELKDLASAINQMLNRINESYQTQIRFVSDASHELRTPISVIQGYANLLDRWGKNDEKTMQESIDAIKAEAQSMQELVEHLLFLARGDNESIQLRKEEVDICQIMDEVIKETQLIDLNHNFEVDLDRPSYIEADKQLIKQVIRILVDNSIKYTPHGEKIRLRIKQKDDQVQIIVQDNGIGIEPDHLVHIFDRFYRSDESRARKTGGSGLGLSIAKWIVERHGGHLEILSRVDIGTRITMIIPKA